MKDKNKEISSNLWKYTLFLITNKRVWVSIIAIYYLTIPGVNAMGISYIILAGSLTGVLFELPSGYWSDIIGHRKTLILSRIFAVISSLLYLFATDILGLIIATIFFSLSAAFTSGTGTAFLRETVNAIGRKDEYPKIMGRIKSLGFAIPLLISAFVPLLVNINMALPFVVGLFIDLVGLFIALLLVEPDIKEVKIKELGIGNIKQVLIESYKIGFLKYSVYTGILGGLIFAIGNYRGPYQESFGVSVALFGFFFAAGRLFASVVIWFGGSIQKNVSMRKFFFMQSVLFSIIFIILGITTNAWIAIALFAIQNGIKWGLIEIEDSYFIHLIDESKFKATMLSISAQVQQIIGGIAGLLVGYIITMNGYKDGFLVFAIIFSIIMFFMYIFTFKKAINIKGK